MSRQRNDDEAPPTRPAWLIPVIAAVCVGLLAGGALLAVALSQQGKPRATATASAPAKEKPGASGLANRTAKELWFEWYKQPLAAREKYRTPFVLSGYLNEVGSDYGKDFAVVGEEADGLFQAKVYALTPEAIAGLARCKIGQRVRVKARSAEGEKLDDTPRLLADGIRPVE